MIKDVLTRREAFGMLGGAVVATQAFGDTDGALRFVALDHVAIAVADVEKSVSFYARIFGNTVLRNNGTTRRYLKLGPCYVAIAPPGQGQEAHRVDHICAGIEGFQMAQVKGFLQARGIPARESSVGLFVSDPDGIQVQLFTIDSWKELGATTSPEQVSVASGPIFQPTGLDHVLLRVTDPEKSAGFYSKIFGPVTQRANNRTWFQVGKSRIGLLAVATGGHPGVDHFCVSAPSFDYEAAVKKLEGAGAKTQTPEVAGAPEFRDTENILVQVMGPRPAVPSK
jgi:catechol 2,3-dioxygenase-like lactoylglutathione lyase family enzyme